MKDQVWEEKAKQGLFVDAIVEYVARYDHVSFTELQRRFSPFLEVEGTFAICVPTRVNVLLWAGLSEPFCKLLQQCLVENRIYAHGCDALIYLIDGGLLKLPIPKRGLPKLSEKEWWIPVVLRIEPPKSVKTMFKSKTVIAEKGGEWKHSDGT